MRRTAGSWRLEDAEKFRRPVPEENPLGPQGVSLQSEGTDEAERTLPRGADPQRGLLQAAFQLRNGPDWVRCLPE